MVYRVSSERVCMNCKLPVVIGYDRDGFKSYYCPNPLCSWGRIHEHCTELMPDVLVVPPEETLC